MVNDQTQFTRDVMGRYVCNTFAEALASGRVLDFEINPFVLRNPLMPAQANWAALRTRH